MTNSYFANGKLLLTGEYVVLDGSKAIGLPTQLGQHMTIATNQENALGEIHWEAKDQHQTAWFNAQIALEDFSILQSDNDKIAKQLANILCEVNKLNPSAFDKDTHYKITTTLDFPRDWGLGSSSTLLVLLSKYANINAFDLSKNTFGGSGYDISCAMMPRIQYYQLYKDQRKVSFVHVPAYIKANGYFIHLNQKQNSREGITHYNQIPQSKALIKSISDITEKLMKAADLYEFEDLLYVHESLLSSHLDMPTVQESLFSDYSDGIVKSLGAWGGDFVFVTAENKENLSYFKKKGFETILSWNELIVS